MKKIQIILIVKDMKTVKEVLITNSMILADNLITALYLAKLEALITQKTILMGNTSKKRLIGTQNQICIINSRMVIIRSYTQTLKTYKTHT